MNSRTWVTTARDLGSRSISEIGGRSKLTPSYLRGRVARTPRVRACWIRRARHSHGRATSSASTIHPLPSQAPSGHAGCNLST